ncbi:MAG: polysaccharide deacetylase family protein [Polyangiaceae bacterium]|nr:polysaccharide deacetylase family protein [Polyangiaceae bacterium]
MRSYLLRQLRFCSVVGLSVMVSACGGNGLVDGETTLADGSAPLPPPPTNTSPTVPASGNQGGPTTNPQDGLDDQETINPDEEETNAAYNCVRSIDVNYYDEPVNIPASQSPPGGLAVEDTPLFVAFGFDDNIAADGMKNITDTFQAQGVTATFFHSTTYLNTQTQPEWMRAVSAGYEVANHTDTHNTSTSTTSASWSNEISTCYQKLSAASPSGLGATAIFGFRAPFLAYNNELYGVLAQQMYWYDSSIEGGYDPAIDGTNHYYPYTLDSAGPDLTYLRGAGFTKTDFDFTARPGLMELAITSLIIPPDDVANEYGFEPASAPNTWPNLKSFRERVKDKFPGQKGTDYERTGYKVPGLDWNLLFDAQVTPSEFLAVLKYNFDLHRQGNRAPFLFGGHSNYYPNAAPGPDRLQALNDFITYVKQFPEVRVVSYKEVFDFMREPKALSCY